MVAPVKIMYQSTVPDTVITRIIVCIGNTAFDAGLKSAFVFQWMQIIYTAAVYLYLLWQVSL
jgi:hypothetical protein